MFSFLLLQEVNRLQLATHVFGLLSLSAHTDAKLVAVANGTKLTKAEQHCCQLGRRRCRWCKMAQKVVNYGNFRQVETENIKTSSGSIKISNGMCVHLEECTSTSGERGKFW